MPLPFDKIHTRSSDPFPPTLQETDMSTTLTPYLSFDGKTREAFAFYEKALGAKVQTMMSWDEMPAMPESGAGAGDADCDYGPRPTGDGIMHACLVLPGGARLMAGDTPPGVPFEGNKGTMLALEYDSIDQAHGAFKALSHGGQSHDAAGARILGQDLRHADRSIRRQLGRQRRADRHRLNSPSRVHKHGVTA